MQIHTLNVHSWVDKYSDYLYNFACYKIGKKEDAEDLVQETFLSAYKGRENFIGNASEKTWLISILKNKIVDYYRKPKVVESFSEYLDKTESSFGNAFFDQKNHDRWEEEINKNYFSNASESYLTGKEFQTFLNICLEKMPKKIKGVFISKYLEDNNAENICKEFGVTSSNYWVIIFRSKTLLRNCLEKKGILN